MKKYLLIILVVLFGLLVVFGGFVAVKKITAPPESATRQNQEDTALKEYTLSERPFVSLTPQYDGYRFDLKISKIPSGVASVDYELVYNDASGKPKGVTGTLKVEGNILTKELLLGTCSSGKCRYDKGVKDGTFTIKLRDEEGRLKSSFETTFHLQHNTSKLQSADGKFSFSTKIALKGFYITMETFGIPKDPPAQVEVIGGPYGIFGSRVITKGVPKFETEGVIYAYKDEDWVKIEAGENTVASVFLLGSAQAH